MQHSRFHNRSALKLVLCYLPAVALAAHVVLYGDWIIDDAVIIFAYARNVAEGWGFIAYPGERPG